MEKEYLINSGYKYLKVNVPQNMATLGYDDIDSLLYWIGCNYDHGHLYKIGNAYHEIRSRIDKNMGATRWHNKKLRTSKKEVASIRKCFMYKRRVGTYYMLIPYKSKDIFDVIIELVNEIVRNGGRRDQVLIKNAGNRFGCVFYHNHINTYFAELHKSGNKERWRVEKPAALYLESDFTCAGSPMQMLI